MGILYSYFFQKKCVSCGTQINYSECDNQCLLCFLHVIPKGAIEVSDVSGGFVKIGDDEKNSSSNYEVS